MPIKLPTASMVALLLLSSYLSNGQSPLSAALDFVFFTPTEASIIAEASTMVPRDVVTSADAFICCPPGALLGQNQTEDIAEPATDESVVYTRLGKFTYGQVIVKSTDNGKLLLPEV